MAWHKLFDDINEVKSRFENKTPILLKLLDRKICLVFDNESFYAFDNTCPHNGAQLHRGKCNENGEIVCPLHFYQFDMRSGREGMGRRYELNTYPLRLDKSSLFIRLKD